MVLWIKALHVIAVISWMAGLLYLPRLMVYHVAAGPGSREAETFKVMEWRLLRVIMNPAMVVVWVTGPWLAWTMGVHMEPWLWAKLVLVVGLTWFHHALASWRKALAENRSEKSEQFFRLVNEVPTVLMIGIVVLVVVKPF
jgi:putative membrane protein